MNSMKVDWHPKDFKNVVDFVISVNSSVNGLLKRDAITTITKLGFLQCPAPKWDPHGIYRIVLEKDQLIIQKSTPTNKRWEKADITFPSKFEREKQQKFKILDSPELLSSDLNNAIGLFGFSVIYLDIDNFKSYNTEFTERVVDKTIFPQFHKLIDSSVSKNGFAYAEGGDEIIILLPNTPNRTAITFAEELRELVENEEFIVNDKRVKLTVSCGVAIYEKGDNIEGIPDKANVAKKHSKEKGKNCVSVFKNDSPKVVKSVIRFLE